MWLTSMTRCEPAVVRGELDCRCVRTHTTSCAHTCASQAEKLCKARPPGATAIRKLDENGTARRGDSGSRAGQVADAVSSPGGAPGGTNSEQGGGTASSRGGGWPGDVQRTSPGPNCEEQPSPALGGTRIHSTSAKGGDRGMGDCDGCASSAELLLLERCCRCCGHHATAPLMSAGSRLLRCRMRVQAAAAVGRNHQHASCGAA